MPSEPAPTADSAPVDTLVDVGTYATEQQAFEHSLVVLAMGRACWLVGSDAGQRLMVEPTDIPQVTDQLRRFDRESVGWPPVPPPVEHRPVHFSTPLLWSLVVLAVFWGEANHPSWISSAGLDREAVLLRHEWWRTFTALFLHADVGHLVSNAASGIFVFSAVLTLFGRARGWVYLLAASILGNAASVVLQADPGYRSVGASTGVFAAVGLLTGSALRRMMTLPAAHRWRAMLTPLGAGIAVLALYGVGGAHIDVGAHLTGFVSGLALGMTVRPQPPTAEARTQVS